jgi:hypothetical protein
MSDQYLSGGFPTATARRGQKKDADLRSALVEQFREAMPAAGDIELAVAACLARTQEEA